MIFLSALILIFHGSIFKCHEFIHSEMHLRHHALNFHFGDTARPLSICTTTPCSMGNTILLWRRKTVLIFTYSFTQWQKWKHTPGINLQNSSYKLTFSVDGNCWRGFKVLHVFDKSHLKYLFFKDSLTFQ